MKKFIQYFIDNLLISNVLFFSVFVIAIFAWTKIPKEEMPDFESPYVRIMTVFPGASAEDVEFFITKPIEEELKDVAGIEEVRSVSSTGSSSITVVMLENYPNPREVYLDIQDAALRADLANEAELPTFHQFKSSEKAYIDIGFYLEGKRDLSVEDRERLQQLVRNFETQVKTLPAVSGVDRSGYLDPENHILLSPTKIKENKISIHKVVSSLRESHIRAPIGVLEDTQQSKVTSINELIDESDFKDLLVTGNYEGEGVTLDQIASFRKSFEKTNSIYKINGHEGIMLNLKKSHNVDILEANKATVAFIEKYKKGQLDDLKIVTLDDESYDVKNRLAIVASNGLLGFALIVLVLFLFLDFKSGIWVSMGIPFTLCFTLICMLIFDYTINNMTLAAIIIVMGIVVDDAIIVAENIGRITEDHKGTLKELMDKVTTNAASLLMPITSAIATTCVAFLPLLFFGGWFGKFVYVLPFIITMMLVASLLESFTVLPAHVFQRKPKKKHDDELSWFRKYEGIYAKVLTKALNYRALIIVAFIASTALSGYLFKSKLKFVMFPREESKELSLSVYTKKGTSKDEMNEYLKPIEDILLSQTKELSIVGFRSNVGQSRRGGAVNYNRANINIEILPADERKLSANQIIDILKDKMKDLPNIEQVRFFKSRWGSGSGSTIEIQIQENDDKIRAEIADLLAQHQKNNKTLKNVEIERPINTKEYNFKINQNEILRFGLTPSDVTTSLRTFVQGTVLYTLKSTDEEVEVRLTVAKNYKVDIERLKQLRIDNGTGGYVPISRFITIEEVIKPSNIERVDYKRTTMVYSDIEESSGITPLEVADQYENEVFPDILKKYPSSIINFVGEIEETRESTGDFMMAGFLVIALIYMILTIQFKSLSAPLIIMTIIPIGVSGVIYILMAHNMEIFGFFAVIGALGMVGVVVNDSIVLIDKLIKDTKFTTDKKELYKQIGQISSTRLRAIILTTLTTVIGVLPTAYGFAGYDSMLSEMMLTMGWGLAISTVITLFLTPAIFSFLSRFLVTEDLPEEEAFLNNN
ncbi:efflux RND transporter permease subunit [Halobacteriovorax sp. RZ-2]|uniref:efflux RND transporter permease subunit n=1 Tax=unclassified Halobacteriovorax TaxID=2639665 RepID=UPI00371491E4